MNFTYSANLGPSSPPAAGLTLQSRRHKSPSSEAAQNWGTVVSLLIKTLLRPSSPVPSYLKTSRRRNGRHCMWGSALIASLSTCLESQILTIPSSEIEIKWVCLPWLGFLLSTFIYPGMNWMSETKFLCDTMIEDVIECFILIISLFFSSFSSSASLPFLALEESR